jgi:fatty-acyl-CoA synthase
VKTALTLADFTHRAAAVYPGVTAVVDDPLGPDPLGELSYAVLDERVRRLGAALDAAGVPPGGRVAVVSPNSARMLELLLAVPACGRILVPINFRLNAAEIRYILEHSGAGMVFADPEHAATVPEDLCPVRPLGPGSDEWLDSFDPIADPLTAWSPDEDATATLNYTSGTTARPKGVALSHRALWLDAVTFGLHVSVTAADRYLHTLPLFHVNGWGLPYAMTGLGVPQVIQRKIDGPEILRRVDEHGITLMACAPAVLGIVLDALDDGHPAAGGGRVRVICAGAPPPSKIIERTEQELGWEFIQIYGLTETAPLVTVNRRVPETDDLAPADRAAALTSAGVPVVGTRIRLADDGEVLVRGNHVLTEYWRDETASAAALAGGWFHTGDGGMVDAAGRLVILDRKKDVIITGGENVSSAEVENRLYEHPAVNEAAVIGVPDERWGETVKAVIVVKPGHTVEESELIAFAREGLAHYKCPTSVDVVPAIPRTATGKIQKFKLREPYWRGQDRQVH